MAAIYLSFVRRNGPEGSQRPPGHGKTHGVRHIHATWPIQQMLTPYLLPPIYNSMSAPKSTWPILPSIASEVEGVDAGPTGRTGSCS